MKILIIRFSSIGDIVLTTPVIRCVKQQVPGAVVHFLTKESFASILEGNPYIDQYHFLQDGILATVAYLRTFEFDYILDLHNNQRTFAIRRALGGKSSVFYKMNVEKWLMVNFKMEKLATQHVVDRYMAAAAPLGVKDDWHGLEYYIPVAQEVQPEQMPETHREGYVAIVIGAKHNTKQYPMELVAEVCRRIPYPIVLLGGPEDQANGEEIANTSHNPLVWNACGQFNLNGSASLVRQSRVVVTNDTGLMHIAAAFQKPIISLWGNTVPGFGMTPYYGKGPRHIPVIMETPGLYCRPCSKIGYEKCPEGHFKCMRQIKPANIVQQVMLRY